MSISFDVYDTNSINKALSKTKQLDRDIERAMTNAFIELESRISTRLQLELARYGLSGSRLASSAKVRRYRDGIVVSMGAEYGMFVEFGTGIIGEMSPHPNPMEFDADWEYDTNGHGFKGWWYPTTEDDPNPSKRFSKVSNMWFAFTKGSESKPVLYNTWRYSRLIGTKTINKHLRKVITT